MTLFSFSSLFTFLLPFFGFALFHHFPVPNFLFYCFCIFRESSFQVLEHRSILYNPVVSIYLVNVSVLILALLYVALL